MAKEFLRLSVWTPSSVVLELDDKLGDLWEQIVDAEKRGNDEVSEELWTKILSDYDYEISEQIMRDLSVEDARVSTW
ncbi:hypothetical protein HWB05_gp091 [Streptomyces phage BRock]|uniref:Uncharacterized protein n=1 Tax=Streptomyces phage BRock TaxID=1913591 RepID=A0A1J0GVZ3_9CAUD|nr:hypothetical protein HWB05_gp091 [Streptomyces phage BRock]APC46353.1 hypothetical protein [Streptomyces phage BRock]